MYHALGVRFMNEGNEFSDDRISHLIIHSVKKVGVNPNQALAQISFSEDETPYGYFVALDRDDPEDIHVAIRRKIDSGEIEVAPSDTDPTEYYTNEIKDQRDKLLKESAVYLAEDAPITKEEREELLNYRKSLWSIIDSSKKSLSNPAWPTKPKWLDSGR